MADYPALPLWTDKYFADTRHLSRDQHGAYLLLLMEAWRRPSCSLPDDDALLARLTCSTLEEWGLLKSSIMAFWKLDGRTKEWTQKALSKERDFLVKQSRSQRDRAAKRWNKTEKHNAGAMPKSSPADAPTPTPTPTDHPSDDRALPREITPRQILLTALDEETADAVLKHRRSIKAPLTTPLAARGLVKAFCEFPGGPVAAAEMMVTNGWRGFKREYWENRQRGSPAAGRTSSLSALTEQFKQELFEDGYSGQGQKGGNPGDDARLPVVVGQDHGRRR